MPESECLEVVKDLDFDRFIEYPLFCDFLRTLPMFSKAQCFYLLLGMTGFRPLEVSRLTIASFDFSVDDRPMVVNRITKSKTKVYYDGQGRVLAVKHIKIKHRLLPVWVKDYINNYVYLHYNTFTSDGEGSFYIFPNRNTGKFLTPAFWCVDVSNRRKDLVALDSVKWSWVYRTAFQKVVNGELRNCYCLSLYSFRKSRATWYGQELLTKGVSDVLLNVSHFMGHSKLNTTYTYLKALVSERYSNNIQLIKPPDLSKPIFVKGRQSVLSDFSFQ